MQTDSGFAKQLESQVQSNLCAIQNGKLIWNWCAGALLAIAVVWIAVIAEINRSHDETLRHSLEQAESLSKSYSEQLIRSINEIERTTLNINYLWRQADGKIDLEDQAKSGLYPAGAMQHVTIINREGIAFASTFGGKPASVAGRDFFLHHRKHPDAALRVDGRLHRAYPSGQAFIRFTKRLENQHGEFDGVIAVDVAPAYLAAYNDEKLLGEQDFISIRHSNGNLFVSEKGEEIRGLVMHRQPPVFTSPSGVMRMASENYIDNEARILAWNKVPGYPLASYVGLAESGQFAAHYKDARLYSTIAAVTTVCILVLAFIGMYLATRANRARQQDEEIKNAYHLVIDTSRDGFYMLSGLCGATGKVFDFLVKDCNERGAQFLGFTKPSLIGSRLSADFPNYLPSCLHAMQTGFMEDEFALPSPIPSEKIWVQRRMVRSGSGLAITLRDITESRKHQQTLVEIANTDALTSLPNRHSLMSRLPVWLNKARQANTKLALLYVDLNKFKAVNDTLGHAAGDYLLQLAADRLKSLVRPNDHVARIGGDEFVVVLRLEEDQEEAVQIAARISEAFRESFDLPARRSFVGTSIGISLYPQDGTSPEILMQKADIAMYAAKSMGQSNYQFYDHELHEQIKTRLNWEQEIVQAVLEDQFVMHYQPRVDSFTGELTGLEALVRWQHPVNGLVYPDKFIPLAEETGIIVQLGDLILHKVISQLSAWSCQGHTIVPVSVNISPNQFNAGGVPDKIEALLNQHAIPAAMLEVELTESTMMDDAGIIRDQLSRLNRMGIKLHVDDFGTGYSSLSRLREFNLHVLKIDRSFTSQLGLNAEAAVMFNTIVKMSKALGMGVIAEGVETESQIQIIQSLECDEIQGYWISRPVPEAAIPALLCQRFLFPVKNQAAGSVLQNILSKSGQIQDQAK
jgi:diguanylate cyclase (GGDEF)-like protein